MARAQSMQGTISAYYRASFRSRARAGRIADCVALGVLDPEVFGGALQPLREHRRGCRGWKRIVAGRPDLVRGTER